MSNYDKSIGSISSPQYITTDDVAPKQGKLGINDETPPPPQPKAGNDDDQLPSLAIPIGSGLSLENLMAAIGYESRRLACLQGIERLENKGELKKIIGENQIEELGERVEAFQKQKKLGPIMKALSICGVIVGALVGIAGLFSGGAGFVLAGSIISLAMSANSIVSLATDGEYSIASGVSEIAQAAGTSEETGQYIGVGVELFITLLAAALSFGGSIGSSGAKMAELSPKLAQAVKGGTVVSGTISVTSGGMGIANAIYGEEIAQSDASGKELDAILEGIRLALATEQGLLETTVEASSKLLEDVSKLIDDCMATNMVVQGASGVKA